MNGGRRRAFRRRGRSRSTSSASLKIDPDAVVVRVDAQLAALADMDRRDRVRRRVDPVDVVGVLRADPDRAGAGADARGIPCSSRSSFTTVFRLGSMRETVPAAWFDDQTEPKPKVTSHASRRPGSASSPAASFGSTRADRALTVVLDPRARPAPAGRRRTAPPPTGAVLHRTVRRRVDPGDRPRAELSTEVAARDGASARREPRVSSSPRRWARAGRAAAFLRACDAHGSVAPPCDKLRYRMSLLRNRGSSSDGACSRGRSAAVRRLAARRDGLIEARRRQRCPRPSSR